MFLTKRKVILAKVETTEGTDAVPTVADIIDCRNSKMEQESSLQKKDTHRPSISDEGGVVTDIKGKCSFEVDMKGSGTVGTLSQLGKLLLACGFEEREETDENEAVTGLVYLPVSSQGLMKTVTIYEYYLGDGNSSAVLKKLIGAKGSITLKMEAGKVATAQFNFEGRYVEPTDATNPTVTSESFEQTIPKIVENAECTYDSVAYVSRGVTVNVNNDLYSIPDVNSNQGVLKTLITARNVSGTFAPDMINVSVKNFFAAWKNNSKANLSLKVGSAAGNIIEVSMHMIQFEKVNDADDSGFAYQEIPFIATGEDSELKFIFR